MLQANCNSEDTPNFISVCILHVYIEKWCVHIENVLTMIILHKYKEEGEEGEKEGEKQLGNPQ